jgi:hypothetical protein
MLQSEAYCRVAYSEPRTGARCCAALPGSSNLLSQSVLTMKATICIAALRRACSHTTPMKQCQEQLASRHAPRRQLGSKRSSQDGGGHHAQRVGMCSGERPLQGVQLAMEVHQLHAQRLDVVVRQALLAELRQRLTTLQAGSMHGSCAGLAAAKASQADFVEATPSVWYLLSDITVCTIEVHFVTQAHALDAACDLFCTWFSRN